MSLYFDPIGPIPEETTRVARAAFPKGNLCLSIRDALGTIYNGTMSTDLFSHSGQSVDAPWRLALICVLQYLEDLSDRQAAEAVRSRIDWKYLLGLDLTDPRFDLSALTEFRNRQLTHQADNWIFDRLVERLNEEGWIKKRGIQRTDSTHILAAVRRLNRLEFLGETLRAALNAIAEVEPEWLAHWVPVTWFERYSRRIEEWRLPEGKQQQEQWMEQIGQDGSRLINEVWAEKAPVQLRLLHEVERLRRTLVQQFVWEERQLRMLNKEDFPPAHLS